MATVGETLQAQLIDAKSKVTQIEAAIAAAEPSWLEADVEKVKDFFTNVVKHLGL